MPDIPLNGEPTLPQELIDLILDKLDLTDKKTLKACSRVARSFRHTSQKHIFSHIKLVPAPLYWRKFNLTLKEFSQILSNSPHLALNVRSIVLVEGNGAGLGSVPWMRRDEFPPILAMLVNLTRISIESQLWLAWDSFPATLIKALQVTVALPSFTSIRLDNVHFDRSAQLVSLLQCCRNLDSLVFCRVSVARMASDDVVNLDTRLDLSSLELDPFLPPLLHSVSITVELRRLRHLCTTVCTPEMEAEAQRILDATENLLHYHVKLSHNHTDTNILNLQNLSHLRTLEIAFTFEFATSPDNYDPIIWASNILATTRDPSPIQHVILNVCIEERDLPYLFRLGDIEPFLVTSEMASLRKVTINLDSFDLDFNIYGGERDICEAFPSLLDRGILEVELLGVT
ncbi:hypothetical protein C8R44DRAFT_96658 [Mycena epipterygia]|nr:hypothetical protein C8R44DRAFT_96658 [Mycena epipterygia]